MLNKDIIAGKQATIVRYQKVGRHSGNDRSIDLTQPPAAIVDVDRGDGNSTVMLLGIRLVKYSGKRRITREDGYTETTMMMITRE